MWKKQLKPYSLKTIFFSVFKNIIGFGMFSWENSITANKAILSLETYSILQHYSITDKKTVCITISACWWWNDVHGMATEYFSTLSCYLIPCKEIITESHFILLQTNAIRKHWGHTSNRNLVFIQYIRSLNKLQIILKQLGDGYRHTRKKKMESFLLQTEDVF